MLHLSRGQISKHALCLISDQRMWPLTRCLNSAERLPLLDSSMFITLVFVPRMLNLRDLDMTQRRKENKHDQKGRPSSNRANAVSMFFLMLRITTSNTETNQLGGQMDIQMAWLQYKAKLPLGEGWGKVKKMNRALKHTVYFLNLLHVFKTGHWVKSKGVCLCNKCVTKASGETEQRWSILPTHFHKYNFSMTLSNRWSVRWPDSHSTQT